jgi:hypothetical protein
MVNHGKVERDARALFARHGKLALEIAMERADYISRTGDRPHLDRAMLIINEIEKLVGSSLPQSNLRYSRLH